MGKRSDTLETTLLALEVLNRIPRNRRTTATELHKQLQEAGIERDKRSIERLLERLSRHFDIERDDRSRPYGYRWMNHAKGLAVPNLTPQESLLLRLAEEQLRHLLPPRLMKSMEGFFAQARRNLGSDGRAALEREWPGKVRVVADSLQLLPPKVASGAFETVSNALYANRWLTLDYRNAAGKTDRHEVMPLGLAQQGPRLYLICRFKGYDDNRNLAMHRILSARGSTLGFDRPADFDLKQYEEDGHFGFGHGQRVHLSFRIDHDYGAMLRETPLSLDQKLKMLDDGWLQVSATVVNSGHLDWWLRAFGDKVSHIRKRRIASAQVMHHGKRGSSEHQ